MTNKKINTTKTMLEAASLTDAELKAVSKRAEIAFGKQKVVDFSIPPAFQKNIGTELFIAVNGVHVVIPVDGKPHPIPEVLAKHGQQMINNITT